MAQVNSIIEADVRVLASGNSFDRGYRYYLDGYVLEVIRRVNLIAAKVEGSGTNT